MPISFDDYLRRQSQRDLRKTAVEAEIQALIEQHGGMPSDPEKARKRVAEVIEAYERAHLPQTMAELAMTTDPVRYKALTACLEWASGGDPKRIAELEDENAALKNELAVLRTAKRKDKGNGAEQHDTSVKTVPPTHPVAGLYSN